MSEETYENEQISEANDTMTNMSDQTMYGQTQNQTNDYNTYQIIVLIYNFRYKHDVPF